MEVTYFLTGCTHFGHENIIKLANRPFANANEMDQVLIANWNEVVDSQDTVYHLGDFAMRGAPAQDYKAQLNGKIICLQGNHDRKGWGQDYMMVKCDRIRAVLFHYPIEEWDGWWRGAVHFHCHTHKPDFKSGERRGNVGVDATNFRPLRLKEAVERLME